MSLKRKPPTGNVRRVAAINGNLRGTITNKVGRVVQFESFAERSLLLRLDRDATVMDYISQPETFHYDDAKGRGHHYTPDFMVWRKHGAIEIHEVTLTLRQTQPRMVLRQFMATRICQARGWQYIVHTEKTLPCGTELANLLVLFRYRPTVYSRPTLKEMVTALLRKQNPMTWSDLVAELMAISDDSSAEITAGLCHLLSHGYLTTDLNHLILVDAALAATVLISLAEQECPQ
jgi:hypothetical protein